MVNSRRGEVGAVIDGAHQTLCLSLGALAELEAAFQVDDLGALAERFEKERLSARDCIRIIAAGLRGAGTSVTDEEVAVMRFDGGVTGCARLVSDLLAAAFGQTDAAEASEKRPGESMAGNPSPGIS